MQFLMKSLPQSRMTHSLRLALLMLAALSPCEPYRTII